VESVLNRKAEEELARYDNDGGQDKQREPGFRVKDAVIARGTVLGVGVGDGAAKDEAAKLAEHSGNVS